MNPHLSIAAASGGFAWPLVILSIAILANAFFAASEIAVVSLNKTKIRKQAEDGDKTSKLMLNFIEEPGRFLSTIQIGVRLPSRSQPPHGPRLKTGANFHFRPSKR